MDGTSAAAVVLRTDPGGSGTFFDLHLVTRSDDGTLSSAAHRLVGDRIRLQGLRFSGSEIRIDFTGFAPTDPLCCPTVNIARQYALRDGALTLTRATESPAHLAVLAGLSLIGWFGGPTTSAAVLASAPFLESVRWLDPATGAWGIDSRELPPLLRRTIAIDRGTGFFVRADEVTAVPVPILPPPAACPLNPGPPDPVDPSVILTGPGEGALLAGAVPVTGFARVFEANVRIRILSAAGDVLADTFTTAADGAPAIAPFATEVSVNVTAETAACVQVFEESAHDGSMVNVVQVGIRLAPGSVRSQGTGTNRVRRSPPPPALCGLHLRDQ